MYLIRKFAGAAVLAAVFFSIGCSREAKDPASQTTVPAKNSSVAAAPAKMDDRQVFRIYDVYLGCKESQAAARKAMEECPGVSEITIDPVSRTIFIKIAPGVDPVGCLRKAGLWGTHEIYFPSKKQYYKLGVPLADANDPRNAKEVDAVTLYRIFAGSAASQEAIRKALSPEKVTFIGDGPVKAIRVEGKSMTVHGLIYQLLSAGFNASEFDR